MGEGSERCIETSSTYHDIDELPDEMRAAILPHLGQRNPMATKELLSQLQVAYITYFCRRPINPRKMKHRDYIAKGLRTEYGVPTSCRREQQTSLST